MCNLLQQRKTFTYTQYNAFHATMLLIHIHTHTLVCNVQKLHVHTECKHNYTLYKLLVNLTL